MNSSLKLPDSASLYKLRPQDEDDGALFATIGADATLDALGLAEGELVKAETVASSVRGTGRKCVDMRTVIVNHDPGLFAELLAVSLLVEAGQAFTATAGHMLSDVFVLAQRQLEQDAGPLESDTLASDTLGLIERVASATIRQAAESAADLSTLVQSVVDAQVAQAARDAAAAEIQRVRAAQARRTRDRDAQCRAARLDEAGAVAAAQVDWATKRAAALERVEQRAAEQADEYLAAANEVSADAEAAASELSSPRTPWGGRLRDAAWSFLFTEDRSAPLVQNTGADIQIHLRHYLRARLVAAAASHIRLTLSASGASFAVKAEDIERLLTPVRLMTARARQAIAELNQLCDQRTRRATGIFLPAVPHFRTAMMNDLLADVGPTLTDRLIREPLVSLAMPGRAINDGEFEDRALEAARSLTNALRNASLNQVIEQLPDAMVDDLAKVLGSPQPTLEFRRGYPAPLVRRRVAVPGGAKGRLGDAILRRFTDIDVVASNEPLLAFGVAITEVFAVDDLEAYHTGWRDAREAARRQGTDRRLVTDRLLLEHEDGITTNNQLDLFVVRAVACGCAASSKEPPIASGSGGTWYLMPAGQLQRPSQVDPARLDTMFAGHRLGRSVPEVRATLRHAAHHRELIDERWRIWSERESLELRIERLERLISGALLPSDDLVAACRELKTGLLRELRQLRFEVA